MAIYKGSTEPTNIYKGSTSLSEIYKSSTKIRPSGGGGWQPGANTIAYYKLESDLDDYSGNGYDLTAVSTVTYSQLASGKNVCFFNDNASVSNFPAFTGDITFSFWVRNSSNYTSYNNVGYIVKANRTSEGWDEANSTSCVFSGQSQGNKFRWQPTGQLINWSPIFTDTNWHYVVCTYNRSTQLAEVYLDGNTTPSISFTCTVYPNSNATNLFLCQYGGSQKQTYLSEVIIEDKIRTTQEMADYYDQTKGDYGIS